MTRFDFSPSTVHYRLLRELEQPLRYTPGQDVTTWQDRAQSALREKLGMPWVEPNKRTPLNVRPLWTHSFAFGVVEKLVFTSEVGADVPAYWCVPHDAEPPYPTMICLQGHSSGMHNSIGVAQDDEQTPLDVQGDRDFVLHALRQGWAALAIEQRSFGERKEKVQEHVSTHGCHDAAMHALITGRTLVGERVWDVERACDFLEQQGLTDMQRLGCMGNSGGGTVTSYAALLPRIACAIPSCCFGTFRETIGAIYHCADNYIPGLPMLMDMGDILGLYASRPLVVVSGVSDPIFPIESAKIEFKHLQAIYEAAGAGNKVRHVIGDDGHRFYADAAWDALLEML